MKNLILVGLGGFLGSVARYKLGSFILHHYSNSKYPYGTLIVNITGCFIIGLLGGLFEKHHLFTTEVRLLLFTGILGGFTTFSAFGYETILLIRRGETQIATLNIAITVICGIFAVWLGSKIGAVGHG
ncbi:MAG: fluoride efflux transporter CrcB [Candidatus Anammoxibacter sp.]